SESEFELSLDESRPRSVAVEGESVEPTSTDWDNVISLEEGDSESESEFELSLDGPPPRSLAVEGESVEADFFETDFDVPALGEKGGSEVVVINDEVEDDLFL